VIPRGGETLIRVVAEHSKIPSLKHFKGNCHVYVDADGDLSMAEEIVVNSKVSARPSATPPSSVLVHEPSAADAACRGSRDGWTTSSCAATTRPAHPPGRPPGDRGDWYEEYLDYILGVKVVGGVDEAIRHINTY
jgi:glutamate-5-semialdehyde dehydrogenase